MNLAKEVARRSEEDLRALMERNPDVMVVVVEGRIVACNPAMVELSGRSTDQIVGSSPLELLHPDDRKRAQDRMRAVLNGDRLQGAVYRGVNADGEVIDLEIRTVPITFRDERALLATIRDVRARTRAEEALRRSESSNFALLEALIPDVVFRVSRKGEYLDFRAPDPAALAVPPDRIIGTSVRDALPPELAEEQMRLIERACDSGEMQTMEFQLTVLDGVRAFEARMMPSGSQEVVAIVRDVTDRKPAESLLKEREEDLSALTEGIADGVGVVVDGRIVRCNTAMADLVGSTVEQLLGTEVTDYLHPDDRERAAERIRDLFHGGPVGVAEYRMVRADGEIFPVAISSSVIRYGGKKALATTIRDVTEQKRREEALRLSEGRLRESQRIAHVGSWGWDVETDEAWWSDETYRIFGIEPEGFEVTYESYMA